jgi:hypothetical protein
MISLNTKERLCGISNANKMLLLVWSQENHKSIRKADEKIK